MFDGWNQVLSIVNEPIVNEPMGAPNHYSPVAETYARAMIELANEQNQAEAIGHEFSALRQVIAQNPTFQQFLSDPAISQAERGRTLKNVFTARVSQPVLNFLGVLNDKGRTGLLSQIADAYDDLLDEQLGKIEVNVTVAQKLTDEQLQTVRQRISAALKKDAVIEQKVDDSIIGGLVLRVQDQLIDASVKHQLEAMREQLLAARPK